MCVAGRLFGVTFAVAALIKLAYEFVLCVGKLSGVMNFVQEVCMVVSTGVVSLSSFWAVLGPVLSPFGSLAMSTFVGEMCRVYCSLVWCCIVMRVFQLFKPRSHRGTRCLSEYCMGVHCCRTILSCSFVPMCPCIETRLAWRVLPTSVDASLMLVVMALYWLRGGRPSNSSPVTRLASLRMRSVGRFSGLDSSASLGQWLNCDRRRWTWA